MRLHELIAAAPAQSYLVRKVDKDEYRYVRIEVCTNTVRLKVFNKDSKQEEPCSYMYKEDFAADDWEIACETL